MIQIKFKILKHKTKKKLNQNKQVYITRRGNINSFLNKIMYPRKKKLMSLKLLNSLKKKKKGVNNQKNG